MKIALALVLNAALLAVLLPWLRRQWQWATATGWRGVLGLGLGLRVAVGLQRALPLKLDAKFMSNISYEVTGWLWAAPGTAWQVLTQTVTVFQSSTGDMVYQNSSNTWTLIKLLALLNLASLGAGWLNALYLSLFAFAGCWLLVRLLAERFPGTPAGAGAVALLLWPSVWFWATGISKEAVLLGSGAWLTARVLGWLFAAEALPTSARNRHGAGWWAGTLGLTALHLAMRYFFALPLLMALAGLAVGRPLARLLPHRWAAVLGLGLVIGTGAWLGPELSVAFRGNKFVNQIIRVYTANIAQSADRPHFEYPALRPTAGSIAAHAPRAVANALTQPWLGQTRQPLYLVAGLENACLLALLGLALWALVRRRGGHLPFSLVLALGVFCLLLAFLMGITTPNLGSLHRYRSTMLPFLLLLLLQNDYAAAALHRLKLRRSPADEPLPGHPPNA